MFRGVSLHNTKLSTPRTSFRHRNDNGNNGRRNIRGRRNVIRRRSDDDWRYHHDHDPDDNDSG